MSGFKVRDKGNKRSATILFEVTVPDRENYQCLARKVLPFDLKEGSELRRFLEGWLGADYFKARSNQRTDLEAELVGKLCEVELIHAAFDEDKYNFPLVDVAAVYPPKPTKEGKD